MQEWRTLAALTLRESFQDKQLERAFFPFGVFIGLTGLENNSALEGEVCFVNTCMWGCCGQLKQASREAKEGSEGE